jgi:hypothetical protein
MQNFRPSKQFLVFLGILLFVSIILVSCQNTPVVKPSPQPPTATLPSVLGAVTTATSSPTKVLPTQTEVVVVSTPTPFEVATATTTPAPVSVVKEENGWVTYRNEIVGYEISAPKNYTIKGGGLPAIGNHLLGPGVPDEEINNLIAKYYGDSLNIWIRETNSSGQDEPWLIGIYAYDIIVKDLGGMISPGGVGDYQLTARQETLNIDGQSYPVKFTVQQRNNQPVGELAVLNLEKDGIEFMFGYVQPEDNPEAYQTYLHDAWPVLRQMIETYKHIPES